MAWQSTLNAKNTRADMQNKSLSFVHTRRLRFWSMTLMLAICMVCACDIKQTIKNTYEDITMPAYEVQKFNWGAGASFYSIEHLGQDGGSFIPVPHENWMKDAQGNIVAGWLKDGSRWGGGSGSGMGKREQGSIAQDHAWTWYDYADDSFYQLNAELPSQKWLYELMQKKELILELLRAIFKPFHAMTHFKSVWRPKDW